MGRKSKLTPAQWAEVERRLLEGEPRRAVGRDFGISDSAIKERMDGKITTLRSVAEKIVAAETALEALPPLARISANNLACKLRSISDSLAAAGELGARTAHRLQALANSEVAKVDDAAPMASLENLRNVGVLTKLANDSASIALNLLAANKDTIKKLDEPPPDEQAAAAPADLAAKSGCACTGRSDLMWRPAGRPQLACARRRLVR
jgi:hypothetical protein